MTFAGRTQLQEVAVTAPSAVDVVEQIVANLEIVRLNARACLLLYPRMLSPSPACRTTLLRKSMFRIVHHVNLPPGLRTVSTIAQPACACDPVVLEDVLLDDHVARALQFEQILDGPPGPPRRDRPCGAGGASVREGRLRHSPVAAPAPPPVRYTRYSNAEESPDHVSFTWLVAPTGTALAAEGLTGRWWCRTDQQPPAAQPPGSCRFRRAATRHSIRRQRHSPASRRWGPAS